MAENPVAEEGSEQPGERGRALLWVSGAWAVVLVLLGWWIFPATDTMRLVVAMGAVLLAPLPAVRAMFRQRTRLRALAAQAREEAAQLKLQLETVRYRTSRLREELQAADRQARLSHQLTLLGQFTAGFMHEFNNPLAIVAGRLEVLLEERRDDAELCADLRQMLQETRYMSSIARTLLQALRRERADEVFEASAPQKALDEAFLAFRASAEQRGVKMVKEFADAPKVDVPEHVVGEVVRGLISNALEALDRREEATVWIRLEPYHTAGSKVVIRVEDNGPGVPEAIRDHLFEPFISHSSGRERLGLGLFLAASLMDMYEARIHYELREGGGSRFTLELPPARFTRGQPYHWFAGGMSD